MADELRVNGNLVGWGSWILKIDGERWTGVQAIDWEESRERVDGYGMGREHAPLADTPGKYVPGRIKVRMFTHTANALIEYYAAKSSNGKAHGNVKLPWLLQCAEGSITQTNTFENVSIAKRVGKVEETPEGTTEEWEFKMLRMQTNGKTLYDSTKSG